MPMPLWWGKINKRVWNPRALENGKWAVLAHVGRSSGNVYRTPLDATEIDGSFVFILVYGSGSDWVQNVLAAKSASLQINEEEIELASPRLLTEDAAWELLDGIAKRPPGFLNIDEYLQMDIVERKPIRTSSELSETTH